MELWKEKYASNMKNKVKIRSMGEKIFAHKSTVCTANIWLSFSIHWNECLNISILVLVFFFSRLLGPWHRQDDWPAAPSNTCSSSVCCNINYPWSESPKNRIACDPWLRRIILSKARKGWSSVWSIWKWGENEAPGVMGNKWRPTRWLRTLNL